jgi:hypothetical protein
MEATIMKTLGFLTSAALCFTMVAAAPAFAQEQHDQKDEQKAKPEENEKKTQSEKSAKPAEKPSAQQQQKKKSQPAASNANQGEGARPAAQKAQPQQRASNGHNRIPDDKFKAHFGQEHRFRVSQADYSNHRFAYGGYSFGFIDPWPSNWLYTQDVYVVEIDGVYYLCNASYPGVNLTLSFAL